MKPAGRLADGPRLLGRLTRRARRRRRAARSLIALAIALPTSVLPAVAGWLPPVWGAFVGLGIVVVAGLWPPGLGPAEVVRHLDRVLPRAGESAELLLAAEPPPTLLVRIERGRLLDTLADLDDGGLLPWRPVRLGAGWLALSAVLTAASAGALAWRLEDGATARTAAEPIPATAPAGDAAEGPAVTVEIVPPAYTERPARRVTGLDVEAAEGARLVWRVGVAAAVAAAASPVRAVLRFDDLDLDLEREPSVEFGAAFTGEIVAGRSRLYHLAVEADGVDAYRSPTARLEVIHDAPPELEVREPERVVEIDPAAIGHLRFAVAARDDYGLGEAALRVTLATGRGEMVAFREKRLEFTSREVASEGASKGATHFSRRLDLEALGLEPGAELYVFAEVEDNRQPTPQRSRTPTHIVRVPGGDGGTVGLGAGVPLILPPESFRSQRQIILDTEKLLADRPAITEEEFRRRSTSLGIDQRALRMRYGVLLGEEFESGVPVTAGEGEGGADDHDHTGHEEHGEEEEHQHGPEEVEFSSRTWQELAESLPEGLMHVHDSAESNTLFNSDLRATLKAAVAQMWDAEARLRTFEPASALPFEVRALELLKKAQEAERIYVRRIGFEAPVVQPEKRRLTGDLSEIADQRQARGVAREEPLPEVRGVLEILAQKVPPTSPPPTSPAGVFESAADALAASWIDGGSGTDGDLAALDLLRDWSAALRRGYGLAPTDDEVALVESALWRLLPVPDARPIRRGAEVGPLFDVYLERLEPGG